MPLPINDLFQQKIIKPTKFDFATWSWSYPIIYFPWHDTMPHRSMWHLKYVISLRQIPAKSSVSQTLIRKCLTLPLFCLQVAHGTDCKGTKDCVWSFEKSMMKATNFTWTGHMIVIILWLTGQLILVPILVRFHVNLSIMKFQFGFLALDLLKITQTH